MAEQPKNNYNDSEHFDEHFNILDEGISDDVDDSQDDSDDFNTVVEDIDFSQFKGEFKTSLHHVGKTIAHKKKASQKRKKLPLNKTFEATNGATISGKRGSQKTIKKILIPRNKNVIVEGVDKFILSNESSDNSVRNIGYYKGEKLKTLIITFNNNSAIDFNLELFNPSMPLDYLYSTSLSLNDKIQISAGDTASYTDVLFYLLANPTLIANAKFTFGATNLEAQKKEALFFINKSIKGSQRIKPLQLNLQIDTMQKQDDIVFFDIIGNLGRPYIPDGMDVIRYKVLAGSTVTFGFYYKQHELKKLLFKEAKDSKGLL